MVRERDPGKEHAVHRDSTRRFCSPPGAGHKWGPSFENSIEPELAPEPHGTAAAAPATLTFVCGIARLELEIVDIFEYLLLFCVSADDACASIPKISSSIC